MDEMEASFPPDGVEQSRRDAKRTVFNDMFDGGGMDGNIMMIRYRLRRLHSAASGSRLLLLLLSAVGF